MNDDFITMTIGKQKNIALIAHDGKKAEMVNWCQDNKEILKGHFLSGTGTTARMITEATGLPVRGYCDFYALDEYKIGTVGKNTLKEMFECETAQQFLRASMSVPDDCKACRWFAVCRNGCRRERELLPDGGYGKYRRCEAVKAFFDKNEQEIAKSLRLIGFYQSKAK